MYANKTIPSNQFDFQSGHDIIEQLHRVVNHILKAFCRREFCNGVFLGIQHAVNGWHPESLAKAMLALPANHYCPIRS